MKLAGFLLLVTGWAVVLAALIMFPGGAPLTAFILSGAAVEILGLGVVIRSHLTPRQDKA